jgi:hypothetical protein
MTVMRAYGNIVVETLCYKPEGHRFEGLRPDEVDEFT